jgi:hypothetical protein
MNMAVSSARPTSTLHAANGYGQGGSCATTKDSNGNAVFDSTNYEITVTSDSSVTVFDKGTGITTLVAGDPHLSQNGAQLFDFHGTTTILLRDGTKLTMDTMPWGDQGATVVSRVTITNLDAKYGVQINGASLTDGKDISFEETLSLGEAMDDSTADGNVMLQDSDGLGFTRFDVASNKVVAVDQRDMDGREKNNPAMFDPDGEPSSGLPFAGTTTTTSRAKSPSTQHSTNSSKASTMTSVSSTQAFSQLAVASTWLSGQDASSLDVSVLQEAGYSYGTDGAWSKKVAGGTISFKQPLGAGSDIEMTFTATSGLTLDFNFTVDDGKFAQGDITVSGTGSAEMDVYVNQAMSAGGGAGKLKTALQMVEDLTDPSKKKKKGEGDAGDGGGSAMGGMGGMGGAGAAGTASGTTGTGTAGSADGSTGIGGETGDSSNWFIALAEAMGEVLNKLATELKDAVDAVVLDDTGQPPYKEGMRIQGLAQQLQFISQAFLTALNSVGEATKSVVTAGGAAR